MKDGVVYRRYENGADRDRTDDLLNAIQALSQLSYSPEVSLVVVRWLAYAAGVVKDFGLLAPWRHSADGRGGAPGKRSSPR